ncbi:nucleolar protein 6 [Eublepharis macularius]|uniref:Nucleolar protein 6 n=1 Tax=Eublepharis macularius TaxID=481883 RepID=A0AA97L739_EUBMA|nr:nucleolar protein 6 [Eublepharis macularius]
MSEDAERDAEHRDQEGGEANEAPAKESRSRGKKRRLASEGLLQPVKICKAELYKPPTSEELSRLKETENLFHSNLLRLQIEELLKEVVLKEKRKQKIDAFLHQINAALSKIPETREADIADQSWLPKDVKVPFVQVPFTVKGRFRFLPPVSVKVVGSYLLGTCIKPAINVDVALTMPREIFQDKDNLNQRYHRKRALYLAYVAHRLAKEQLLGSVMFAYAHGNHLKPMVVLQPQEKDAKMVTVRLYACPPQGLFKASRLHPSKNNVRTAWFTEKGSPVAGADEPPTPHYNNSILCDLMMESHLLFLSESASDFPGMRDGVALLKVWLRQRELDKGFGCFNGFLASMLVAYLLSKHQINRVMSGYQVLRNALQFLASTDLTTSGISVSKDTDGSLPTLTDFHRAFQVVFVDPSGLVNLCADMTSSKYKQLQFEAKHSMDVLDDKTVDGFQLLLMTHKPLIRAFDHVFHLKHVSKLQAACRKMRLLSELLDHSGNYVAAALPFLLSLLERGLAQRVLLLTHSLPQVAPWPINVDPPKHKDTGPLSFGLLLSPDFAASILEKGPEADCPEAVEFRKFWGERSELRRFQDGSICEAVLWNAPNHSQKRLIPEQVIRHLLQLHMDIPESAICYTGALLESVIKLGREPAGTGEEDMVDVVRSYDDLSRKLWNLEGLPLTVTAVQGTHPALRYTDVFPPVPMKPDYAYYARNKDREFLVPLAEKPCPAYVAPMKVMCHMEGSGQWPPDKDAVQRVKAAFQVKLAELLYRQHHLLCRPGPTYTDVYKDGYIFRLQVAYHREPQILKEVVTPEGMLKYQDTEESLRLELETIHLPFVTSALHGLQQQHPAFGATSRLAKRWVSAQLLSDGLSEECMDLLVASLFLCPAPFTAPSSPQVGFLRFLLLLTTFDWKNSPLIVNLNAELKDEEYVEIRNDFVAARPRLPALFIASPRDRRNSIWTKERPSAQILLRLLVLAQESLRTLEEQLMDPLGNQDVKVAFRPPLDFYDVLVHLNPKQIPRHLQAVDRPVKSFSRGMLQSNAAVKTFVFPVVDYDPVQLYLQELREAFDDLALFFYDKHGGEVIGVLWKPSSFEPQPFKTSNMRGKMVLAAGTESTVPNVAAILEDFEILGDGLVRAVEARTEKWSI